MTLNLPPAPVAGPNSSWIDWAKRLRTYMIDAQRFRTSPRLQYVDVTKVAPDEDGILAFNPVAQKVVVSINGAWTNV